MEWIQVAIETTHEKIDELCDALSEIGIGGFEIEDPSDFDEFMKSKFPYRDYVDEKLIEEKENAPIKVKIYISCDDGGRESFLAVKELIARLKSDEEYGSLELSFETLKEEDWTENWKQFFHPLKIGKRLLIRPEWEDCENEDGRVVFTINPGMSFGTGSHATTQFCLEALEKYTKEGDEVLDLGCGSGILSITACLLGAKSADACDIDEKACDIAMKNAAMNGVSDEIYHTFAGNILSDAKLRKKFEEKKYDIVLANIVADVIIGISPFAGNFEKDGGILVASGIITDRLDEVLGYLKKSFEIIKICEKKDWASVICRPKAK